MAFSSFLNNLVGTAGLLNVIKKLANSTVVNDLKYCKEVINSNGIVLCDDYNLGSAPGVKKAIDEFVRENNFKCEILCDNRFAKIFLN